jgi:hypothetical protein
VIPKWIIAVLVFGAVAPALAHDDAEWIMQEPRYRDASGIHCCGPKDCGVAPKDSVIRVRDGWKVVATDRVFHDRDPDLYVSKDEQIWLCNRHGLDRCLFTPGASS